MKKYKLIKTYPGSPKLDTIVDHHYSNSQYGFSVHVTEILDESWKEYWEEIIEKDYKTEDGVSVLEGDKVAWATRDTSKGPWKVKYDSVDFSHKSTIGGNWKAFSTVKAMDKWLREMYPKSLFITEDRVAIYVGDNYWTLNTKIKDWIFGGTKARADINYFYGSDREAINTSGIYYFSTKEKAIEYLLLTKCSLSMHDVLGILGKKYWFMINDIKKELLPLVKSKNNII